MGTTVLTAHLDSVGDAYISPQSPNTNTGDAVGLTLGNSFTFGGNVTGRIVMRISLSRLDPSAAIVSASLRLFGAATIASSPATFYCRRLTTTDWAEDTVTYNSPWDTAGGDYTTSGEISVSVADGATSLTITGLKDFVDAARADGTNELNLILFGPETTGASNYFLASSFDAGSVSEPTLTIVDDLDQDLVEEIRATVDLALQTSTTTSLFSTRNNATSTYVRHSGCWAVIAGVDLSPLAVWNSADDNKYGCVLVHNQIGVVADHVWGDGSGGPGVSTIGATFRFLKADGSVATGTVATSGYTRVAHDLALVKFTSALSGVGIARVLPENYFDYFRHARAGDSLPVEVCPAMFCDQESKALITMFYGENDDVSNDNVSAMNPTDVATYASSIPRPNLGFADRYANYFELPVSGDSSHNGATLFIDGKLVVTCSLGGGDGAGTSITHHLTETNAAMDALVSGASLTQIDLSGYRTYTKRSGITGLVFQGGCRV